MTKSCSLTVALGLIFLASCQFNGPTFQNQVFQVPGQNFAAPNPDQQRINQLSKSNPRPSPVPNLDALQAAYNRFPAVRNVQNVLVFSSNEHVLAALEYIDGLAQNYNQQLLSANARLANSNGEIAAEESLDGQKPYADFEASLRFNSLRAVLVDAHKRWLRANNTSNDSLDPFNNFVIEDNVRSILNPQNELAIGNVYYRFRQNGQETYNSLEELQRSRDLVITPVNDNPARRLQGWSCGSWRFRFGSVTSGTRRITWMVGHYWWPWGYRAVARTANYRRWLWIWWWAQAWTYASVYGYVSADAFSGCTLLSEQCAAQLGFNLNWNCYNFGWGFWKTHILLVGHKTAPGWVRGAHFGINGLFTISTLT